VLRTEMGHERFKVQQLVKLRDEAAEAQRRELRARRGEEQALSELSEVKRYVDRRDSFDRNEKAGLLQRIGDLERQAQELQDRECCLRLELQEATAERDSVERRNSAELEGLERWRRENAGLASKLKHAEQRVQQLEQKHDGDKAKIKLLADKLRAAAAATDAPQPQKQPTSRGGKEGMKPQPASLPASTRKNGARGSPANGAHPKEEGLNRDLAANGWAWLQNAWLALSTGGVEVSNGDGKHKLHKAAAAKANGKGTHDPDSSAQGSRQQHILGGLVAFIMALALAKMCI